MNIQELATAYMREAAGQGAAAEQPAPGHGGAVGGPLLRRQPRPTPTSAPATTSAPYPDFVTIAKGFGCGAGSIADKEDLDAALEEMIDSKARTCWTCMVPYQEHVLPMIPGGHDGARTSSRRSRFSFRAKR